LAAFVHGCEELIRCGAADRLPRVVGVQAAGAAPLARSFEAGRPAWEPVSTRTIADGIDVGDPYFGRQALDAVEKTGGSWRAVSWCAWDTATTTSTRRSMPSGGSWWGNILGSVLGGGSRPRGRMTTTEPSPFPFPARGRG